ncbi:MAG: PadR family transcriptional regulator [Syntrophomonadaceae bacterium]
MKVPFYLLGLLIRFGPQHGYSLKQSISLGIADFAKIKLPTIYYHLERMAGDGFLSASTDRDGNRPEKTVYAVTEQGREYFKKLSQQILVESYQPEFNLDGLLYFSDLMDSKKLIEGLLKRRERLNRQHLYIKQHYEDTINGIPPDSIKWAAFIFKHHLSHFEAEIEWINKVVAELSTH